MNANSKTSSNKNNQPHLRRSALATASVLALGGFLMTGAMAQVVTSYSANAPMTAPGFPDVAFGVQTQTPLPAPILTYTDWISNQQDQHGTLSGAVTSGGATPPLSTTVIGATYLAAPALPGALPTPVNVDSNFIRAVVSGNVVIDAIDMAALDHGTPRPGLIIISGQMSSPDTTFPTSQADKLGTVSAVVAPAAGSKIFVLEANQVAAPITLNSNSVTATATQNSSDNSITGLVPVKTPPATGETGSITAGYAAGVISSATQGTVNIVNQQTVLQAGPASGSGARIGSTSIPAAGASVSLDVSKTIDGTTGLPAPIGTALTVNGNNIAAAYTGNTTQNLFNATAGSADYTGSVVVSNGQAIIEGTMGVPAAAGAYTSALVTGSSVSADIRQRTVGSETDLTGTLSTNDNAITATSTGSRASNTLQFASITNLTGTGSTTTNSLQNLANGNAVSLQSDLALFSGQANSATSLESVVTGGTVSVKADNVSGTISTNGNDVIASSAGNVAGNLINANATNFNATAAAGNLQTNAGTPITATNTSGAVTVGVGLTGNTVTGTVSLNNNTLGAAAEGNVANTRVAVAATTGTALATGSSPSVTADAQNGAGGWGQAVATSGISATNLQGNYYGVIGASAGGSSLTDVATFTATFADQTGGVLFSDLSGAQVAVNGNLVQAYAAGSSAATGVALSLGNTASVQAAVGNTQFNASTVTSRAVVSGGIEAGNISTNTNLTVNNNTVDSTVLVNNAANSLTGQVGNVLGVTTNAFAVGSENVTAGDTAAVSNAAFGVASAQFNRAANTAMGISGVAAVVGTVADSVVSVNANEVLVSNTTNKAANNLNLTVGNNVPTLGANAGPIAGISNLQVNDVAVPGVTPSLGVIPLLAVSPASVAYQASNTGVNFETSATNATLSVNGNTETAVAKGNTAERFLVGNTWTGGNTLVVSGTNLSSPAAAVTTGTIDSGVTTITVQNEFALLNKQTDSVVPANMGIAGPMFDFNSLAGQPATTTAAYDGTYAIGRFASANATNTIFRTDFLVTSLTTPAAAITNSTMSLLGNETLAQTANNAAYNNLDLNFTVLKSGAGLLNQQESTTSAAANSYAIDSIYSRDTFTTNSTFIANQNTTFIANQNKVMALVQGSDASNTLRATGATTLTGNANLDLFRDANTAGAVSADFGLVNNQRQIGDLTAYTSGIVAIDLAGVAVKAHIDDSNATVKFNEVSATAQATKAANSMILSAGDMNGVSGALGSTQNTQGGVRAFQGSVSATFMFSDGITTDTPVTVSNNTALAKAGQNEATNNQYVLANTLTGGGAAAGNSGANASSALGVFANTDFSVVNVQSGTSAGNFVGALSQGNLVGSEVIQFIGAATRPSLAVDNNTVRAEGTFNRAVNTQVLAGGISTAADGSQTLLSAATVNATGAVVNTQVSSGVGKALVDAVQVGTARAAAMTTYDSTTGVTSNYFSPVGMEAMTNAETTVNRNKLQAQIDGNVAGNALWVDASTSVAGSPAGGLDVATFAVRNYQVNSANLDAGVTRADVGVFMENVNAAPHEMLPTPATGVINSIIGNITNSNVTVSGNSVDALATANTQTSRLNVKSAGTVGDTANPSTYTVQNDQFNVGAVTAKVGGASRLSVDVKTGQVTNEWAGGLPGDNVNIGIKAVGAISGSMNVSNNTETALANGNTSIASEISVSGGNSVYTPVQRVQTTQFNGGALTASVEGYGAAQADPGGLGVGIQAGTTLGGQNTVNDNKLTAGVAGNTALSNVASTVTAGTVYDPAVSVYNSQDNVAPLSSSVARESVGIKAGTILAGANTVNGNFQTAQTFGNTAGTNGITVKADNILADGTQPAVFNVSNFQTNTGPLTAEVVTGTIGIQAAGSVAPLAVGPASITDSASTVSNNKLTAVVGGNTSAANTVTLTGQNTISNPLAVVLNDQFNTGTLQANVTTGSVGIRAGSAAGEAISGGTSTVNGNSLVAQGQANLSESNAITASAPNITAPQFTVQNLQFNAATGDVTSAVTNGSVGVNSGLTAAALTLLTGSNTTVSGNTLSASAEANKALSNAITVSGSTILNGLVAPAAAPNYQVLNTQTNAASTRASLTGSDVGVNATTVASLNASVSDNLLVAKAGGNLANANKISVTADNSITGSGIASTTGPNLYVENRQSNLGGDGADSVSATVGDARVGILNTGAFTNVNASVLNNQVVAYGYGNWASNGITLSQLPGNSSQATAGVSNQQMNSQSITSVVYNVNIGLGNGGTNGTSGGFATVSGNGVTAQVIGNYASNRIGVK